MTQEHRHRPASVDQEPASVFVRLGSLTQRRREHVVHQRLPPLGQHRHEIKLLREAPHLLGATHENEGMDPWRRGGQVVMHPPGQGVAHHRKCHVGAQQPLQLGVLTKHLRLRLGAGASGHNRPGGVQAGGGDARYHRIDGRHLTRANQSAQWRRAVELVALGHQPLHGGLHHFSKPLSHRSLRHGRIVSERAPKLQGESDAITPFLGLDG
uniref:Uncharacterized protein n=1 Tax=uncultured marine microorganism HF4000_APKG7H23 TaxID=455551 RepID=B3T9V6_9ZZZZ|nr:hypothetical protein ALOHA_HF4000APKG7H23ctg3g30 [uncultured marine microorganism HF4000_APKG7H23]